jgi:hypothetical protein
VLGVSIFEQQLPAVTSLANKIWNIPDGRSAITVELHERFAPLARSSGFAELTTTLFYAGVFQTCGIGARQRSSLWLTGVPYCWIGGKENRALDLTELVAQLRVSGLERSPLDPNSAVMNFTLYGIDIPLWLLFSLALIGLATCVVGGTIGAVSILKLLVKPALRRLIRTPI